MLNLKYAAVETEETGMTVMVAPDRVFKVRNNSDIVYFQNGECYHGEDLPPLKWKEVPAFFWKVMRENYSAETREKYNIILPEDRKLTPEELMEEAEAKKDSMWKCDQPGCGEEVAFKLKAVHLMAHGRDKAKAKKKKELLIA